MNASAPPPSVSNGRHRKAGLWRRLFVWLLGAGLVAGIIAGFRPRPIEVETAVVAAGPMRVSVLEEGKTRIRHRHIISPPVAGMLERIPLRAGDQIEAGKYCQKGTRADTIAVSSDRHNGDCFSQNP